jgi:Tol biopolymer transport system component/predicted Ser/Thr protein kinase
LAIRTGQHLGPYEILSAIGAGGMGEVYRARDTRLDRIIAVKVLPSHLADKPELRERFDREARTIASLNHPHICVLHDIGQQDGISFLVMEYLEGETLAERLKKGQLPLSQVLQYSIEIANALDKAHRKGITHRDLKPNNILLTKSGTKLLDFGLAKLRQDAAPGSSLSQLPTANEGITAQGTILGTLQYMSPEQLEGKTNEIDARTDLFAFGAVVYEMATGRKAFDGESQASVIARILDSDPPSMVSLQPMTPPALDRIVKKCLRKDPDDRWQSARDVTDELKWIAEGGSQSALPSISPAKALDALGRRGLLIGAGALLSGALISGIAIWHLKPTPIAPVAVSRSVFSLPAGDRFGVLQMPVVALSPDGRYVVYVASRGNKQQLYLRAMDTFEARALSGTEGALAPFFSPDGQWIGFFAESKLKKISVSGGTAVTLGTLSTGSPTLSGTWGANDSIVFQELTTGGLWQISAAGGSPKRLNALGRGEATHRWPVFLPGGKAVLFAASTSPSGAAPQIELYRLDTGERRNLISGGTNPYYSPTGHLLYVQGGTLMGVPFDLDRMQVRGTPVPVVEGVMQSTYSGSAQYSISENGSLAYVPGGVQGSQSILAWVNRMGLEQPLPTPPHSYRVPRLSPDGKRVAVALDELGGHAWIYDLARDALTRLTFEAGGISSLAWTRDGKALAFNSGAPQNLFWQPADGSGKAERLTTNENQQNPISWSPDGQTLAYMELDPSTNWDIWLLRLGDRKPQAFLRTSSFESVPQFSPDGRWLAYVSDESGRFEIYVQPYPGPGGKWQISTEGGTEPVWNPNGRELFYRNGTAMMSVDILTHLNFSVGKPRILFQGPYLSITSTIASYDVSPDGQRFLMLKAAEQQQSITQINIVQNWFEELKQKVPTGKK